MAKVSKSYKDKLAKRREELSKRGNGSYDYFLIKDGTTRMRPLPLKNPEAEFAVEVTTFFLGKDIGTVISPVSFGGRCAIMEKYNELRNSKKDSDKEFATKYLKPKKRFLMAHIKYKDEKGKEPDLEAGAKLTLLTGGLYQALIDLFIDDEAGDFTDRDEGYDIKYKRTGKGQMDTEYSLLPCKSTKLHKDFYKLKFDPEKMAKELTPTYEATKETLKTFLKGGTGASSENSSKSTGVKKKKKKIKDY